MRKLLIEKIQLTNDDKFVYLLNDKQKQAIEESRQQIIKEDYLTEEESNKENGLGNSLVFKSTKRQKKFKNIGPNEINQTVIAKN